MPVTEDMAKNRLARLGQTRVLRMSRPEVEPLPRNRELAIDLGKQHVRIGIVSDTHGGSKFEQLTALRTFYQYADEREVDFFIHAGDMTQGSDRMHLGMEHEVHAHGADAQASYVVATYPRSSRDVPTYVISGNHDDSFIKDGGQNIVRQIVSLRSDLIYLGQDAAFLTIGKLRSYVIHPDGGMTKSKSLKGQHIAESLPRNRDVKVAFVGHYHSYCAVKHHGIHVFMLPCFQSQYAWLARKGLNPEIGGLIVDLWLDGEGNIPRIAHELVSFEARDNDWDRDASDLVNLSWSNAGLEVA